MITKKVRAYVTDFPNPKTAQMDGVIAIPHLGASSEEAEENCAIMASTQVRNYLEHGSIKNSVNYPEIRLDKKESKHRISILCRLKKWAKRWAYKIFIDKNRTYNSCLPIF